MNVAFLSEQYDTIIKLVQKDDSSAKPLIKNKLIIAIDFKLAHNFVLHHK